MRDLFAKWSSEPVTGLTGRVTLSEQEKINNINHVTSVTDVTGKSRQPEKNQTTALSGLAIKKNTGSIGNSVTPVTLVTCVKLQDKSCSVPVTELTPLVTPRQPGPDLDKIMAESIRCCDCEHFKPVSHGDQRNGLGSCHGKPWDGFRGQWPRKVHRCPAYSEKGGAV